MGEKSAIEWLAAEDGTPGASWNPTRGCSRVSEGCRNCYAERNAIRSVHGAHAGFVRSTENGPRWTGRVELVPERLELPLRWKRPRRIFVNSLSDLFHESLPDGSIDQVFAVMALARRHTFVVLTKRARRMREWSRGGGEILRRDRVILEANRLLESRGGRWPATGCPWPLPNVWLGVSAEDQATFDERVPDLFKTLAAVRVASLEPLLAPITIARRGLGEFSPDWDHVSDRHGLDWIVVGGESGPGARPCSVDWIRSIVRQCREARVACFVKQFGTVVEDRNDAGFDGTVPAEWPDGTCMNVSAMYQGAPARVLLNSRKGGDPNEWPPALRVREFPTPSSS